MPWRRLVMCLRVISTFADQVLLQQRHIFTSAYNNSPKTIPTTLCRPSRALTQGASHGLYIIYGLLFHFTACYNIVVYPRPPKYLLTWNVYTNKSLGPQTKVSSVFRERYTNVASPSQIWEALVLKLPSSGIGTHTVMND